MNDNSMTLFSLFIIALMFLSVARGKTKRLNPVTLWIFPLLFLSMVVQDTHLLPQLNMTAAVTFILAAITGLLIGVLRANLMHFSQDKATGEIRYGNSYLSLLLYLVVILAKLAIRYFFTGFAFAPVLSAALLIFALASITARRLIITMKYFQFKNV